MTQKTYCLFHSITHYRQTVAADIKHTRDKCSS
ncbi:hypothetical protein MEG_00539 [Bartonella tamiae Th307]|uniref:Uncharacterized protein n=1 Tax=Bartonella tamiae Th239 TaxID=1094558 RepID=J1JUZ3_9HYPH|nr:hypothetical protein ME5_01343 [Bartonella tamiae Th239]EJF94958.1 hypothetical protein MEG_00539 [Bartonella tamiae Th307]